MKKIFIGIVITIALLTTIMVGCSHLKTPDIIGYEDYVVQPGDTLWNIAKESNGWNAVDTREIIHDIKSESNCTADIYPGDVIYIPVYDIDN